LTFGLGIIILQGVSRRKSLAGVNKHNGYFLNKQMIIDNSCLGLANTQDEKFTPLLVIKIKGNDVDIWIRDYNPPRCF
jgi:hypothetical protein